MSNVVGFQYEADLHCNDCAEARFGKDIFSWNEEINSPLDNEGNVVGPVFDYDDVSPWLCADCGAKSYHWKEHERAIDAEIDWTVEDMGIDLSNAEITALRLQVRAEMDIFDIGEELGQVNGYAAYLIDDIYMRRAQTIWDAIAEQIVQGFRDEYDTYAADLLDLVGESV